MHFKYGNLKIITRDSVNICKFHAVFPSILLVIHFYLFCTSSVVVIYVSLQYFSFIIRWQFIFSRRPVSTFISLISNVRSVTYPSGWSVGAALVWRFLSEGGRDVCLRVVAWMLLLITGSWKKYQKPYTRFTMTRRWFWYFVLVQGKGIIIGVKENRRR